MAGRPPKQSLDFAGWAVDIFDNDKKIDKLLDAQSCQAFTIYFYLCQRAYGSNGYYLSWCYDDAATTARKLGGGVCAQSVKETVSACLQIGLFDKALFDMWGILTSRGIQRRYRQVALTRTDKSVIQEYWLLSKEESAGLVFHTLKSNFHPSKLNYDPPKSNYQKQKESKVKESKEDTPAKPESPPRYGKDSDEMRLALLLAQKMRENNEKCKLPNDFQKWCNEFRLIIERDGRTPKEIAAMIAFSQWDSFWKGNILSPSSLRKQFDKLTIQAKEAKERHGRKQAG